MRTASGNKMPANGWRKRQIMQWIPEEKGVIDKSAAKRIATLLEWQPKREWVGLTDEEKEKFVVNYYSSKWDRKTAVVLMNDYEAKLRELNT